MTTSKINEVTNDKIEEIIYEVDLQEIMEWCKKTSHLKTKKEKLKEAICNNDVRIIDFLLSNLFKKKELDHDIFMELIEFCCEKNNLSMIRYLHLNVGRVEYYGEMYSNKNYPRPNKIFETAIIYGSLDMIIYLYNNYYIGYISSDILLFAIKYNKVDIVRWFLEQKTNFTEIHSLEALNTGNPDMIKLFI